MVAGDHPTGPTLKSVRTRATRATTTGARRTTYMTRVVAILARTRIHASAPCWRATRHGPSDHLAASAVRRASKSFPRPFTAPNATVSYAEWETGPVLRNTSQ